MKDPILLIYEALERGQRALNEYESKQFLSQFGIPICREAIAYDAVSAATEASPIGFPIVLKASGANLTHKTELGGVILNLRSEEEVTKEGRRLLEIRGCEALLVQEMVTGDREIVCGMFRDLHFGPCVMFGLGGVLTEIFEDVVFRMAPLALFDAQEMVQEIRSKKILGTFREQLLMDLNLVSQILTRLGEIGTQYEEIEEIDINPLKIRSNGKPVAVDALIVQRTNRAIHG